MKSLMGWPTVYLGIVLLSTGAWINSGEDAGLIVSGLCVAVAGTAQVAKEW